MRRGIVSRHGHRCARVGSLAAVGLLLAGCGRAAPELAGSQVMPHPVPADAPDVRYYRAPIRALPIVVDGRLDDAGWAAAPWSPSFVDIEGSRKPAPTFETRVKLLWDSTALYIGARLEDPDLRGTLRTRDTVIFLDNDFEVFLDPDGDTHHYYELEINALGTVWDLLLVKALSGRRACGRQLGHRGLWAARCIWRER